MKKATAILLAFFVAWSALQPCIDRQFMAESADGCLVKTSISPSAAPSSHGCCAARAGAEEEPACEDEEPEGACDPSCSCQCCGTVYLQHRLDYKLLPPSVLVRQTLSYLPQYGQEFPHLIWQPPPFSA